MVKQAKAEIRSSLRKVKFWAICDVDDVGNVGLNPQPRHSFGLEKPITARREVGTAAPLRLNFGRHGHTLSLEEA